MWKFVPGKSCIKCGADWLPFYFYRWKNGKLYGGHVCKLCWREDRNQYLRRWAKKHKAKLKLKNQRWEQENREYRLKYRKQRRLRMYWNSFHRRYENQPRWADEAI